MLGTEVQLFKKDDKLNIILEENCRIYSSEVPLLALNTLTPPTPLFSKNDMFKDFFSTLEPLYIQVALDVPSPLLRSV